MEILERYFLRDANINLRDAKQDLRDARYALREFECDTPRGLYCTYTCQICFTVAQVITKNVILNTVQATRSVTLNFAYSVASIA